MAEKEYIYVTVTHPFDKDILYKRYAQSLGRIILNRVTPDNLDKVIEKLNKLNLHIQKESDSV